ncbi:SapB/AmfS family lanthipeptide [Actinoplanes flavus]|nr:SapB/AmfS family lanthipeptide [Actinoplanes flavus]
MQDILDLQQLTAEDQEDEQHLDEAAASTDSSLSLLVC